MISLEEAIERELYRVEANRDMADSFHTDENIYSKEEEAFRNREDYHSQIAEWLRELVHLRNITEYIRDMVTCFEFMDLMHYNEDIIEWAESELRVDMREVNADDK